MSIPYPIFPCLQRTTGNSLESKVNLNQLQKLLHTKCSIFSRGSSFFLLIAAGACWHWNWSLIIHLALRCANHNCGFSLLDIVKCNMTACFFFYLVLLMICASNDNWSVLYQGHLALFTRSLWSLVVIKNQSPFCFQPLKTNIFMKVEEILHGHSWPW